jgi:2-(1,2-epoxy-1,2-dihydrophenyl)acetyl-CoA isomerase
MSESRSIATGTEHLQARVEEGVAILTMNRPERRNALSGEMLSGLEIALEDAETADDVRCVVLTGAGGAFCAGGDVKGMAAGEGAAVPLTLDERIHRQRLNQRNTAGRIYEMPKPVIGSLDAKQAEQLGLVNRLVPESALEEQTLELARRLASGPTVAYRYMKENINRAASGGSLGECLDLEATHHVHAGLTEDHSNAARAFVEKREPVFKGR